MKSIFHGFRRSAGGLLFCAITLGCSASQTLDVKSMLDWGWVRAECTTLDTGQVSDAFDGDTGTLIRTAAINPLVLTLTFSETQFVTGFRTWFLGGENQWKVEAAATLTDLNGGDTNTSYRLLVPVRNDPESQWNSATLASTLPLTWIAE